MTIVLGYCTFVNVKEQDHLFIPVLAEEIDGVLEPIEDPIELFPTEGTILVEKRIFPSSLKRGNFGLWQVFRRSEAKPGSKFAEYKAYNYLPPPPEIIKLPISSRYPDEARALLMKGINLPYELSGNPVIEFADGLVVGPISIKTNDTGFYCEEEAFQLPLNAWGSKLALAPLFLKSDSSMILHPRVFCGYTCIPVRESFYDMASLKSMIASSLRFACRTGPGTYILSRKEQEEIIQRLSSLGTPEHIKYRVNKTTEQIQYCIDTSDKLADLMEVVLGLPAIEWELELTRRKTEEQECERLRTLHQEKIEQLQVLEQKKADLNEKISELAATLEMQKQRAYLFASETEELINLRTKKAVEESAKLLADVAILKPFLGSSPQPKIKNNVIKRNDYRTLSTFDDVIDLLSKNFQVVGLLPSDSKKIACEISVAIALGQAVFFEGIMATVICDTVATSLSAHSYVKYIATPDVDEFIEGAASKESLVVIDGINKYCVNTYALEVLNIVANRAFSIETNIPRPIVVCTVANDPGAIPYNQIFSSYGPIVNVDSLLWKKKPSDTIEPGKLDVLSLPNLTENSEGIEEIESIIEGIPIDPLWRVNVLTGFQWLKGLESKYSISALNSVIFGWVLPRAKSVDVDITSLLEESVNIEALEQRIRRSI